MRKNQTARSETGFYSNPVQATATDIMLFADYVVLHTPSSTSGHGIVFFTSQQEHEHKCYFFTTEVTDCLRLTLKMVININLYCETYALWHLPVTMTGDVTYAWAYSNQNVLYFKQKSVGYTFATHIHHTVVNNPRSEVSINGEI